MKKKILSVFLSCFIIISTSINSFAVPIAAAIPISYEALMALMGVGVAFGLALPKDDSEYYDYTNSLRNHLQVVDEKYLDLLDKSVKDWKDNNDHKPEGEKDKLKIPYIPGLSQLFENVGNDVSKEYQYINTVLNPIKFIPRTIDGYKSLNHFEISNDKMMYFDYEDSSGVMQTYYMEIYYSGTSRRIRMSNNVDDLSTSTSLDEKYVTLAPFIDYETSTGNYILKLVASPLDPTSTSSFKVISTSQVVYPNIKPGIPYSPLSPDIENDELPIELPNINIPNIEELPGYYEGLEPPFEVAPPYSPGTDSPGTDSPGADSPGTNEGLFPDKGSITDYIKSLIVPSDSFWTDTFNEFRTNLGKNFPMLDMSSFNNLLVNGKPFPNLYAFGGKIVDGDTINSIVDWLRPIVAGFVMLLLLFFNYRKLHKIIRNSDPYGSVAEKGCTSNVN